MRMKSKRLCSLILALSTVFSLVPTMVSPTFAAETGSGVILSKDVILEDDGTYSIDLSGFVTGETTTSQVENAVPLDVVLVLDSSSSMLKFKNTPDTYSCFVAPDGWNDTTTAGTVKGYPANASWNTNLWRSGTMSRKSRYYNGSKWMLYKSNPTGTNEQKLVRASITIPVKPGDKIYCSSFRASSYTGSGIDGIPVTFFRSSGKVLKTLTAAQVFAEYSNSEEYHGCKYITVPESAYIMNIPVYYSDKGKGHNTESEVSDLLEAKTVYNLSLGEERYNPVSKEEFNAMRAKVLQQQLQVFADALAEHGLEHGVQHKLAIATFGGGTTGVNNISTQGKYEKHVGVNGYNNYVMTNTGVFINGAFKNYYDADYTETNDSYTPVYAADLDTSKSYYCIEPTADPDDSTASIVEVTYDSTQKEWISAAGKSYKPQPSPYAYNSYYMFYSRSSVKPSAPSYKNALTDVLVDGKLNPDLQYAIDRYVARGTTHTELGMAIADEIFEKNLPRETTNAINGQKVTSKQIVILFTDGETNDPDEVNGKPTYQTIFYRGNRLKHKGVTIYTIGVADEENAGKTDKWMDQLSSNYTDVLLNSKGDAASHTAAAQIYDSSKALSGGKFYKNIQNMSDMSEIFTSITTDISTSETNVKLDATAVMRDYLANGLKLPADFSFSNIKPTIIRTGVDSNGQYYDYSDYEPLDISYVAGSEVVNTATGDISATYQSASKTFTLTVTYNLTTGMVSVTGFNYAEYYIASGRTSSKTRRLRVQITGVEATEDTPTDVLLSTNTTRSGIAYTDANGGTALYPFPVPKTQLASVNYVMDYAQPLTISADGWGEILGIAGSERLNLNVPTTMANGDIVTQFGTFVNNGNNTYTFNPSTMQWSDSACFYVLRKLANGTGNEDALHVPEGVTTGLNQWVKVNVVPANNIYYENSFGDIHYIGNWVSDGTSQNKSENPEGAAGDADGIHGWEENLNVPMYSDGIAHKGTVSTGVKAEASFTFTGTGVDIYGRTNETTGTVLVTLQGKDKDGNAVSKGQVVDTQSVSGDYYQIPAVSFTDLPYGTYTVTVRVTTAVSGRFTYYLDGVRVYEPLDNDMSYGYAEQNAEFSEIRDLLEKQTADAKTGGAVFVDKAEDGSIGQVANYGQSQYGMYGPKNEVYLAAGQSITFKVDTYDGDAYYYVGLKVPAGKGSTLVKASNGDDTTQEFTIGHSTDMYYHVTPDANGYITIENSGTNLLSVTKVRIAGAAADAQVLTVSNDEVLTALDMFSMRPVNSMITAPEVQTPAITLKSPTLSLEDSIKLNIYFTMDLDVEPVEIGMLTWLQAPDVVDFATADSVFTGCNMDDITGEYYVSTAGIPAQNLGDTIYFCVYARMADGSYVYSKQVQYSPTTYAYNQLEGNADAATKALLVSILNYGAAAQKYLGYKTDALVDRDLSEDMKALVDAYNASMVHAVSAPSAAKQGAMAANGGFKAMKPTIALDGAFAINYYFTPDRDVDGQMTFYYWDAADFEAADVLDMDNATGSCVMTNKNGTFGATIDGIAAKDIDGALYACGVYTDVEGNTYSTGVLPYSVGFYCGNQAQGNDATAALATAIAVYGYYAASYFA